MLFSLSIGQSYIYYNKSEFQQVFHYGKLEKRLHWIRLMKIFSKAMKKDNDGLKYLEEDRNHTFLNIWMPTKRLQPECHWILELAGRLNIPPKHQHNWNSLSRTIRFRYDWWLLLVLEEKNTSYEKKIFFHFFY